MLKREGVIMKCVIGRGLKEALQVLAGIVFIILFVYGLLIGLGYSYTHLFGGLEVSAISPYDYYITVGAGVLALAAMGISFIVIIYHMGLFIYTNFMNPRKILQFFVEC